MENLPKHHHSKQLDKLKDKMTNGKKLKFKDTMFLFDTIEQLEGELKEWITLYETNIKLID